MPLISAPTITEEDSEYLQLKDFIGKTLVALALEKDTITTQQYGEREIVWADFWEFDEKNGTLVDLGTVTVFWIKLRKQLDRYIGSGDAIVGKLMPGGKSYLLVDLEPALLEKVSAAWDALESF